MSSKEVINEVSEPMLLKPRAPRSLTVNCGSKFIIKQDYTYDENGEKIAKPGNKLDFDAYIQASKASCDIAAIIAKYEAGDESVLNVHQGFVGDTTVLPKDVYDVKRMNELYDSVNSSFDKLPDDLKALFNNSSDEFLNSLLNNKAQSIIDAFNKSKEQPKVEGDPDNA